MKLTDAIKAANEADAAFEAAIKAAGYKSRRDWVRETDQRPLAAYNAKVAADAAMYEAFDHSRKTEQAPHPLDIPECLRISPEERRKARENYKPPAGVVTVQQQQQSAWAKIDEYEKEKARAQIAKLKASHPGQVWDQKRREWVDK